MISLKPIDITKAYPWHGLWVAIFSLSLLLAPSILLETFSLTELTQNYRPILAVLCLVGFSFFVTGLAAKFASFLGPMIEETKERWLQARRQGEAKQKVVAYLQHLSVEEQQVLYSYINDNTRTRYYHLEDGVIQGLVRAGILYRASSMGNLLVGFAFNLIPDADLELRANPTCFKNLPKKNGKVIQYSGVHPFI